MQYGSSQFNDAERQAFVNGHFAMLRDSLGEDVLNTWAHKSTTDLTIDSRGFVIVKQLGIRRKIAEFTESQASVIVGCITALTETESNDNYPLLDTYFPIDDSRATIIGGKASDAPILILRKRTSIKMTIDMLVKQGILTPSQGCYLKEVIRGGEDSIFLLGSTGSGKTTFMNGLLHETLTHRNRRVLILEDSKEIQVPEDAENVERLYARRGYGRFPDVEMHDLLYTSLRADPDEIWVGESRRPRTAAALFEALDTGHRGGGTFHGKNILDGLHRYVDLVREGSGTEPSPTRVARTCNVMIYLKEVAPNVRKAMQIARCDGFKNGEYQLDFIA